MQNVISTPQDGKRLQHGQPTENQLINNHIESILKKHQVEFNMFTNKDELVRDLAQFFFDNSAKGDESVIDAKIRVFSEDSFKKGSTCPVCERHVQIHKYTVNKKMAACLVRLYLMHQGNDDEGLNKFFHVTEDIQVPYAVGGSWAKLRFWGLIEMDQNKDESKDTRTSGMWKLTSLGKSFVENKSMISKYITLYNGKFRGFKGSNITIDDCFDKKFSYAEVMMWAYQSDQDWEKILK